MLSRNIARRFFELVRTMPSPRFHLATKIVGEPDMRGLLIFTSLLASVAALRAPARVPPTGRAVVGRRFVLSAALLAPSAATAASLSSQLAGATGLAAQLEAGQKAPKAAAAYMGNEADARFADIIAADLVRVRNTSVQHRCHCGPCSADPRPNPHPHPD